MFLHQKPSLGYSDLRVIESPEHGRQYITPSGAQYPSITTVLGATEDKSYLDSWRAAVGDREAERVCRHACTRGTLMHDALERHLNNQPPDTKNLMPHVAQSYKNIKAVLDHNVSTVYLQECALYSDYLRVAGRVDVVGEYCGVASIIDFKTSTRVKSRSDISSYFKQAAAYAIMFEERTQIPVPQIVILMAVDHSPHPIQFVEKRDSYVPSLLDAVRKYYTQ
jgi:ATP-dependent exoDNAse (exonuclease V) beta subunit